MHSSGDVTSPQLWCHCQRERRQKPKVEKAVWEIAQFIARKAAWLLLAFLNHSSFRRSWLLIMQINPRCHGLAIFIDDKCLSPRSCCAQCYLHWVHSQRYQPKARKEWVPGNIIIFSFSYTLIRLSTHKSYDGTLRGPLPASILVSVLRYLSKCSHLHWKPY